MARVLGNTTPTPGTGTKTIAIGLAATWAVIKVGAKSGGDTYFRSSDGIYESGTQFVTCVTNSLTEEPVNGKIIRLKDSSGTVVMEGSMSISGSNIVFNLTTNSLPTTPQILIWAGN